MCPFLNGHHTGAHQSGSAWPPLGVRPEDSKADLEDRLQGEGCRGARGSKAWGRAGLGCWARKAARSWGKWGDEGRVTGEGAAWVTRGSPQPGPCAILLSEACSGAALIPPLALPPPPCVPGSGDPASQLSVPFSCALSNVKKVSLELGGKSPLIIFADCDLRKAVQMVRAMEGGGRGSGSTGRCTGILDRRGGRKRPWGQGVACTLQDRPPRSFTTAGITAVSFKDGET